ncbi:hypothetical protein [Aeromonas sp. R7-3]|jgi:hypothetical protein|uniref:hypothetical protein n=1 Tax=Aeromonas sp. R7-3 TaxID=3138475 RepID=UPI0034A3C291
MIIAIVSPSTATQEAYIHKVMASSAPTSRFSVQGRRAYDRPSVLLGALRRDAHATAVTILVPVTTVEEVDAIRLMGGFIGHVYGPAHPSIKIKKSDLILANPTAVRPKPCQVPPHELHAELRTRLLAQRDRIGRG